MIQLTQTENISQITDFLYVGSKVRRENYQALEAVQPELVISMIGGSAHSKLKRHDRIIFLTLRSIDSFFTPIRMRKLLQGVRVAMPVINRGGKVLVYCVQGKRRSVTMAAAILIARGYTAKQASELIKEKRQVADPTRWYVKWRISRFEKVYNRRQTQHVQ